MSAHPYGKDLLPARSRSGRRISLHYRIFPQPAPITVPNLTSWEAPDPAFWVPRGYAVITCDLRSCGTSEGTGEFLNASEGRDYAGLIAWAGTQTWSNGKVRLDSVSYLAISQCFGAAGQPAPTPCRAICPWEGLNGMQKDFTFPGGVREADVSTVWFH